MCLQRLWKLPIGRDTTIGTTSGTTSWTRASVAGCKPAAVSRPLHAAAIVVNSMAAAYELVAMLGQPPVLVTVDLLRTGPELQTDRLCGLRRYGICLAPAQRLAVGNRAGPAAPRSEPTTGRYRANAADAVHGAKSASSERGPGRSVPSASRRTHPAACSVRDRASAERVG